MKEHAVLAFAILARAVFGVTALAATTVLSSTAFAQKKSAVDKPTIACEPVPGDDGRYNLKVTVTAGATGLPAGFSIQWMTADEFLANGGWVASEDVCKASFSGNANDTIYNLQPGTSLAVYVGSLELNNLQGYSTNCGVALECGTDYVFRAFGHATNKLLRSDFSDNTVCSTSPCEPESGPFLGCTKSQGYFRNQGAADGTTDCAVAYLMSQGANTINGISFTSGAQAAAYLDLTGPGSPSQRQKQLLALALNIAVSDAGCVNACDYIVDEAGNKIYNPYPSGFGDAVLCGIVDGVTPLNGTNTFPAGSAAVLNGQTVRQVFATVNAGGNYGLSAGDVTSLLDLLNLSFDGANGTCCGASAFGSVHLRTQCP